LPSIIRAIKRAPPPPAGGMTPPADVGVVTPPTGTGGEVPSAGTGGEVPSAGTGGVTPPLRRQVLRLALPVSGEYVLSMTVGIVDTILVGHLGAPALAAVSLASEWVFIAIILFWGVATGATALVARAVGARDFATASGALRQSMLIAALIGLAATALAVALAGPALALMGAAPRVMADGATYLRIVALVFPLHAVMYVGNACLRGAGHTRTAMGVMAVVNLLNIAVAWLLINGPLGLPRLGVAGSALGALAGRSGGGLLVIALLLRGRAGLKLELGRPVLDLGLVRRMLRVGLPTGVEQMAWRLGTMAFARTVASIGTVAVAAHAVVLSTESLAFMPGFGFAVAATALVGQYLGAGDPWRAERGGYITFQMAALVMGLGGLILFLFPHPFIGLFTDDPAVLRNAVLPLRIICIVESPQAAAFVFSAGLRGAGDTRYPMLVTTATIWLIRVPAALLLGLGMGLGLAGAWAGVALDLTVRAVFYTRRFRRGGWKLIQV
jgi:MATE family multidrug resistance protein